jgi:hypothetical protein
MTDHFKGQERTDQRQEIEICCWGRKQNSFSMEVNLSIRHAHITKTTTNRTKTTTNDCSDTMGKYKQVNIFAPICSALQLGRKDKPWTGVAGALFSFLGVSFLYFTVVSSCFFFMLTPTNYFDLVFMWSNSDMIFFIMISRTHQTLVT